MTEPDSPEPAERPQEPTPEVPPEAAAPSGGPAATPQYGHSYTQNYGPNYGPPPADPFVPRYREPWLNPAKRTPAALLGAAAAVVLLALGFLIGIGVGGGHGRGPARHEVRVVMPHPGGYPGMHGPRGWTGYRPRGRYRQPGRPTPSPVPSGSHS